MTIERPTKVLITGGHEVGGVQSFAEALAAGFEELAIPSEIVSPKQLFGHLRELRDPKVLKILSTTAVFAVPFARRVISIAHGIPCAVTQGWSRGAGLVATYRLTNTCSGAQLVAVSDYTGVHLHDSFKVKVDAVIRNPIKPVYLEPYDGLGSEDRCYITYVGRLLPHKKIHCIMPAICQLVREVPGLRACIIGQGPQRELLEEIAQGDERIEFKGCPDDYVVRDYLRRTKVFVSGNPTEGLGITYLEALSQGCVVAMPASGGGLEIAIDRIGKQVALLPISLDHEQVLCTLRRALGMKNEAIDVSTYTAKSVAAAYLEVGCRIL